MRNGAFFDIDGTLVKGQTQQQLARVLYRQKVLSVNQTAKICTWFLLYKLGLIKSSISMRKDVYRVLGTRPKSTIDKLFEQTQHAFIAPQKNTGMQKYIDEHKVHGSYIVAISASLKPLCDYVCQLFGIDACYATQLVLKADRYTGEWEGEILEGQAKAKFVRKLAHDNNISLEDSYAYADNYIDIPFLECVGHPVVVGGDKRLRHYAQKSGWRILDLDAHP